MNSIFQSLRPFIRFVVARAHWVLLFAVGLSALGLYNASNLRVDTDFSKLIPAEYESVQALERLRATVGGESELAVVIESPSFEANKAFAEAIIPRALVMQRPDREDTYFTRVDYKRETAFIESNALYFATEEELLELEEYLEDQIEDARLAANPFFFDLEDDEDDEFGSDDRAERFEAVYRRLVVSEYPISADSTTMVLRFYPTGSQTNIGFIENAYADMRKLVAELHPEGFHPEMEVVLAGRLLRQLTEVQTITDDVISSFGAGVSAVLLFVILYFFYKSYTAKTGRRFNRRVLFSEMARIPVMGILIGVPLLMSLAWTFGVAYAVFGSLNLMTSTLGLVLFGLGVDYGIHFYARYSEERGRGRSVTEAAEITFSSTGQAITIGALTTAAALYVLVVADFRGFSEFGFIAGTGILFALISMTVILPAMLALAERFRLMNMETISAHASASRGGRYPMARGLVVGSFALVVAAVIFIPAFSSNMISGLWSLPTRNTTKSITACAVRSTMAAEEIRHISSSILRKKCAESSMRCGRERLPMAMTRRSEISRRFRTAFRSSKKSSSRSWIESNRSAVYSRIHSWWLLATRTSNGFDVLRRQPSRSPSTRFRPTSRSSSPRVPVRSAISS
jgi:uncharacterized protein